MIIKSKTLKNLLTTISSLIVVNSGIAQVEAKVVTGNGAGVGVILRHNNNQGNNIHTWPGNVAANFVNGDSFVFTNATTLTTGSAVTVVSIDLNNLAAGPFTVAHATSMGSVVDTGGANKLNVIVNDALALMLTGVAGTGGAGGITPVAANTYTGLGNIVLGSGAGGNARLVINANVTLTGAIDGSGDDKGQILVRNGRSVIFDGIIGATKLNQIDIGAAAGQWHSVKPSLLLSYGKLTIYP